VHPTFTAQALIELNARIRLLCEAIGIDPRDVRLEDLSEGERRRLLNEATQDFWRYLETR